MKTTEIKNVLQHINNLLEQGYTIANINMVDAVCRAAAALGVCACGGAIRFEDNTQVIYVDQY